MALLRSAAARDGLWVVGAQGIAALIALAVDRHLFHTLPKPEQGALMAALALGAMLLQVSDFGAALTTIRLGAQHLAEGRKNSAARLFGRMLVFRLVSCLALIIPIFILSYWVSFLNVSDSQALTRWALVGVIGGAVTWWGVDVAQARRSFSSYALQQIASALFKAVAVWFMLQLLLDPFNIPGSLSSAFLRTFGSDAVCIVALISLGALAGGVWSLALESRYAVTSGQDRTAAAEDLVGFGKFACVISVLAALTGYVDIFFVQHFLGEADTAVFACARRLAMALNLLATACITVLLPRAAALNSRAECSAYLRKALKAGLVLAVVTAGGLALAAEIFVPVFGGPNYREAIPILRWLCVAQGLSIAMTPMMLVFYPLRRESELIGINALGLLVLVGLGVWLTPVYRLDGAAWAVVGGKVATLVGASLVLWRAFGREARTDS